VGPGNYDVIKSLGESKKGPTWHKNKNERKPIPGDTKEDPPGPGYYNAEKVDIFPIYKYKPSSVFVSKVARDKKGMPPKP